MAAPPMGGTLSIVAVDRRSGQVGVGIVSQSFGAATRMVWTKPGVGAVVVQGTFEPTYGPLGLALLEGGKTPGHALKSLLATDPKPSVRQVMIIEHRGRSAAHTGKNCLPESGFVSGRGFCVQANFASAKKVWRSAASAFRRARGPLSARLLEALEAGESASRGMKRGGDPKSAALMVFSSVATSTPREGRLLDLRVENSDAPLKEMKGLLRVQEAYSHAAAGEELLSKGDLVKGQKEFARALSLSSENPELRMRFALKLLELGETKKGTRALRGALGKGQDVKAFMRELVSRGIVAKTAPGRP